MKKGEYFILYRANFKKEHKAKMLNLVFNKNFRFQIIGTDLNA